MCDEVDLVSDNVFIGVLFSLEQGKRRKGLFDPSRVDADIVLNDGKQTWYRLWPPQHAMAGGGEDPDDASEGHETGAEHEDEVPVGNSKSEVVLVFLLTPPPASCRIGPVVKIGGF